MKKLVLVLSVVALVALSAATSQAALTSLYTFDSTSNIGANAVSSSLNGTPVGAPTQVAGKLGNAINFLDAVTDGMTVPANTPPTTATATPGDGVRGTISLWFKGSMDGNHNLISLTGGAYLWLDVEPASYNIYMQTPSGGALMQDSATKTWPDTTNWHMLTVSWNANYQATAPRGRQQVYVDGTPLAMATAAFNTMSTNSTFGTSFTGDHVINTTRTGSNGHNGIVGAMDDFSIWNDEFTFAKAKAVYNLANDSLAYNAKDADALFNVFTSGTSAVVGGQTWVKYGTGTALDGTGELTGHNSLALGASGGVQIVPEPGTLTLLFGAVAGLLVFAWRRRK